MKDLIKYKFTWIVSPKVYSAYGGDELPTVTSEQIKTYITNVIQIPEHSLLRTVHGSYHFVFMSVHSTVYENILHMYRWGILRPLIDHTTIANRVSAALKTYTFNNNKISQHWIFACFRLCIPFVHFSPKNYRRYE